MNSDSKNILKKPQKIYEEELKSDLKELMVGLSNQEKLKLAMDIMSQLGVEIPDETLKVTTVVEESKITTTEPQIPKEDSWFNSFEGLFIDKIKTSSENKKVEKTKEENIITERPQHGQIKEFTYEKPNGWNKKPKKDNIFKIFWNGIRDVNMEPKNQLRYDDLKNNLFILSIICLLIYIIISFNSYKPESKYDTSHSYFDKIINYCVDKYDRLTGRNQQIPLTIDTSKPVQIIDTPKTTISVDTPVVVNPVEVAVEPVKPVVKDTTSKKPTNINKNKKDILVDYIKTLPEYSKFGPMDLPYLTQDVNKVDWTFLRADGKTVHFHYNTIEGTFSVSQ